MIPRSLHRFVLQLLLILPAIPIPWPGTLAGIGWTEGGAEPAALAIWHGLVVALALAALLDRERRAGMAAPVAWALAAVVAVVGSSALFAPYRFAAWLVVVECAAFAAIVWLVAREGEARMAPLGLPLGVVGVLQVALAIGQRFGGSERPAGSFLNPNHLAAWLVAVALIGVAGALDSGARSRGRAVRFGFALVAIVGVAVTGSRGAWIGLAVGAAALAGLVGPRVGPVVRRWCGLAVTLLLLTGLLVVAWRLTDRDPFRYHRVRIWKASLAILIERPWAGSGAGQFAIAAEQVRFDDGQPPLRYDKRFSTPHSDLLRSWVELGLPGGVAITWLVLAVAIGWWRHRRAGELRLAQMGAAAALIAWVGQGAVEDLSTRPAIYVLAAGLIGTLVARESDGQPRTSVRFRAGVAFLLLPLFAIGDLAPYLGWRALARGGAPDRARALNPLHPDAWSPALSAESRDESPWTVERYATLREAAERAVGLGANRASAWRDLARVEAAGCRELFRDTPSRERARQAYLVAERCAPFDATLPLERGAFLLDTADPEGARRAAERAGALEPEAVAPRLLLAAALSEAEGAQGAARVRQLLDEVRQRDRSWGDYPFQTPYEIGMMRVSPELVRRIEQRATRVGRDQPEERRQSSNGASDGR